jgi:REP element-mobilizing transposase RayT
MARTLRIDVPDAVYYVTFRGKGRAGMFRSDADRQRFLSQLADNARTSGVVLYAYALMDDYGQLLVRTPRANLSRFMQKLLTAFAAYLRDTQGRHGHQLWDRFKAKLVQDGLCLRAMSRFMHLAPVNTAAARKLGRAQRLRLLESCSWSSHPGYVSAKRTQDFVTYDVLKECGKGLAAARRQYQAYVRECLTEDDAALLEALGASRYAIGNAGFIKRAEQRLARRQTTRARGEKAAMRQWMVPVDEINAAVARHYRIDPEDLRAHGNRCGPAKTVAVELACRLTDLTLQAIGSRYGGITPAAVRAIHRKVCQGRLAVTADVDALFAKLTKNRRVRQGPANR